MTNAEPLPNPPNPWRHAPKSISAWGYAALVLLSVAATAASLFNGNIPSLIITLVVVFGFLIALFALDKITRATKGFWNALGRVISVAVIGTITLLFVEILIYIGTSYPPWLDVWFRPGYKVDPPAKVEVRQGELYAPYLFANRGMLLVPIARAQAPLVQRVRHERGSACQVGLAEPIGTNQDRTTSLTVNWSPTAAPGTAVEISIRRKNQLGEFPAPVLSVPGEQGVARILNLVPGTIYEIKVVNALRSRRSKPEIIAISTDARLKPIGRLLSGTRDVWESSFGQWSAYYTGALSTQGWPQSDLASMVFESWDTSSKNEAHCWLYEGAFQGGLPHGHGKLSAMPEHCEGPQCGSTCDGTFKDGKIETGSCKLFLGALAYPNSGVRQTIYGGPNRYIGEVTGRGEISAFLGPFKISFSGQGTLVASDRGIPSAGYDPYVDTYRGTWEDGTLRIGQKLTDGSLSSIGDDNNSVEILRSACILQVMSRKSGNVVGAGALVSCTRVEIGDFVRRQGPISGFSVELTDNYLQTAWHEKGMKKNPKITSLTTERTCMSEETFGFPQISASQGSDWTMSCSQESATCRIAAPTAGIDIAIKRQANDVPEVSVRTGDDPKAGAKLGIDGEIVEAPRAVEHDNGTGYYLVSRFCRGANVENKPLGRTVSLQQFCPLAALAFARVYGCANAAIPSLPFR